MVDGSQDRSTFDEQCCRRPHGETKLKRNARAGDLDLALTATREVPGRRLVRPRLAGET